MSHPRRITADERRARLGVRHRLLPRERTDDVAAFADAVVALHSSDPASVYLSAASRMVTPTLGAIEAALYDDRRLVRYHAMRRTLWVSTPEVARLAYASSTTKLVGPERRRLAKLLEDSDVTTDGEAWIDLACAATLRALDEAGEATTRQLGEAVPELRQPLPIATGKSYGGTISAHTRVMTILGVAGHVIRTRPTGTWINGQYRWAHTEKWVPGGITGLGPREAAAGLAGRWLRAFGPAPMGDLQWWTGWNQRDTKRALADAGAVAVDLDGTEGWVAEGDLEPVAATEPWVALLPGLDPTTMGWKQRGWYLDPGHATRMFDRNGNGGPAIWADGQIVGGWVQRKDGTIATRLLTDVGREQREAIDAAAHRIEGLVGDTRFTVRFPVPLGAELLS